MTSYIQPDCCRVAYFFTFRICRHRKTQLSVNYRSSICPMALADLYIPRIRHLEFGLHRWPVSEMTGSPPWCVPTAILLCGEMLTLVTLWQAQHDEPWQRHREACTVSFPGVTVLLSGFRGHERTDFYIGARTWPLFSCSCNSIFLLQSHPQTAVISVRFVGAAAYVDSFFCFREVFQWPVLQT